MTNEYKPDSVSHPGETLKECIHCFALEIIERLLITSGRPCNLKSIIYYHTSIDENTAETIAWLLNNSSGKEFWLERQRQYDEWKKNDSD